VARLFTGIPQRDWSRTDDARNQYAVAHYTAGSGRGLLAVLAEPFFSTTDLPGSSQNPQTAAPITSRLAATMNGACHDPNWTKTPKTIGDSAPPMFPAIFIMPDTVPECSPPISMGTAQEGPIVHSRKNMAAVKQYTAV
jgi:hypothetical protein